VPREDGYDITVASEIMAILCLANSIDDLKKRLASIIVGYTYDEKPVTAGDLKAQGAMCALLKDAIKPNLVQTLEGTPAIVHGGPFANIAHGCNSVIATKMAMKLAPVVVTEAGFGADLGAEKFLDIKCQRAGLAPSAIVLVATVRALKLHGGVAFDDLNKENVGAMMDGICNLQRHAENMKKYGVPVIITANRFPSDTDGEIAELKAWCINNGYRFAINEGAIKGSEGAVELANEVNKVLGEETSQNFKPIYPIGDKGWSIRDKIGKICHEIYRAAYVEYTDLAQKQISQYEEMGYKDLAVCMAKTPSSFSDDAKLLGAPEDFVITVREVRLSAGAGFIVPLTGSVMTMPGLPKNPLACRM
jgi:formate--tetrahydrofolate ligase